VVHEDGPVGLDAMQVTFDDERVVCDAGIVLVPTLAERLGVEALAQRLVRLRTDRPGARNSGRKVIALIYAMALGTDCIDDCDVLRAGRTRRLLGGWIAAPSTLGTFLRAFTFGHVRQLDRMSAIALTRAWNFGAGRGARRLVVDIDSFIGEVHGYRKQGAAFGYTAKRGYHPTLATRADTGEVLHVRLRKGSAASPRGKRSACSQTGGASCATLDRHPTKRSRAAQGGPSGRSAASRAAAPLTAGEAKLRSGVHARVRKERKPL
jgi:hypothetical protein